MTPAKTVREQVEEILSRWRDAEAQYDRKGAENHVALDKLRDARWDAATLFCIHASLFAAAEETKAENERLRELLAKLVEASRAYRGVLVTSKQFVGCPRAVELFNAEDAAFAALNPGGSE